MRKAVLWVFGLVAVVFAVAACSSSSKSSTTTTTAAGAATTNAPAAGGGGAAATAKVMFNGKELDFTGVTCVNNGGQFVVGATGGGQFGLQVSGVGSSGGSFSKFNLGIQASGTTIAVTSGTLNIKSDLKSGDFNAKDAVSQGTVTGSFNC